MKYSYDGHASAARGRSSRSNISPYFLEDIGMTAGELERVRVKDIEIVVPVR